jgi:hypothetical protein
MEALIFQAIFMGLLFLIPVWRVFKRAGLNPALSLTVLIPYIGFLLSGIILAASKWNLGIANQGDK